MSIEEASQEISVILIRTTDGNVWTFHKCERDNTKWKKSVNKKQPSRNKK